MAGLASEPKFVWFQSSDFLTTSPCLVEKLFRALLPLAHFPSSLAHFSLPFHLCFPGPTWHLPGERVAWAPTVEPRRWFYFPPTADDRDTESGTHQWKAMAMSTISANADVMASGKLSAISQETFPQLTSSTRLPILVHLGVSWYEISFYCYFPSNTLFFQVYKANWGHQSSYEL